MMPHPCIRECIARNTFCKLNCDKYNFYKILKNINDEKMKNIRKADWISKGYNVDKYNRIMQNWYKKLDNSTEI